MTTDISQYKCPNCGATLPFDAKEGKLKCPHCSTVVELEALKETASLETAKSDEYGWEDVNLDNVNSIEGQKTYVCPSCGGAVNGDGSMAVSQCPYCGNSVIVEKQFEGMLKPNLVIPFKYSKEDAKKAFAKYLKGKKLLAKSFEKNTVIEKLNGLYVPYWLFDADTSCSARFDGERSSHYTEGDYQVTRTDHYSLYRDGNISFDNVPVDASSKLEPELMESLEPFNMSEGVDFNTAYLSGFFADKYDEDVETSKERANERIKNSAIIALRATTIGYDFVRCHNSSIQFSNGKSRYALLPIYIFSAKYNNKIYTFAMNGQTGKFSGNLPVDKSKFWLYLISIFLVVSLIAFIITMAVLYYL